MEIGAWLILPARKRPVVPESGQKGIIFGAKPNFNYGPLCAEEIALLSRSIPNCRRFFKFSMLLFCAFAPAAPSANAAVAVVDDFEDGVAGWSTNDKVKFDNPSQPASLVNVVAVPAEPGGARGSKGAALFTFKAANASWASASFKVDGKQWAQIGAQKLSFWLGAGGESQGFDVVLRGRYGGPDGSPKEEKFTLKKRVDLDRRPWRLVSIPLSDFRSPNGAAPSRLSTVYLLQIVQTGDWDARFFNLDDIRIEGSGVPLVQTVKAPGEVVPPPVAPTAPLSSGVTNVSADFLKKEGRVRSAGNVSIGMTWPDTNGIEVLPLENKAYRDTLATLKPRIVRLDAGSLAALMDSSKPSFDFTKLITAARQTRALGFEPMVALTNPVAWGLDERAYASFASQAAKAINTGPVPPVRLFEVAVGAPGSAAGEDDTLALSYYNSAYDALKAFSKNFWVGGITSSGGRAGTMSKLLGGARGLDFLAVSFYGAPHNSGTNIPTSDQILRSAGTIASLRYAAAQLDKSRFAKAPIFVTQANLLAPGSDGDQPGEARPTQIVAAAWWATFIGAGSRVADQIFHNDSSNAAWGLLDGQAAIPRAYPAYYALWLWNTFLPTGSERVAATASTPAIAVTAVNPPMANGQPIHTLLLTNLTPFEQTVKVSIRGFPVLREARVRVFDDLAAARALNTPQILPKSPFQTLVLKPNAVAVLQFVEPPKK